MVHPALTNYDPRRGDYYNKVNQLKRLAGGRPTYGNRLVTKLYNVTKSLAYPPKLPMGYRSSRYVARGTGLRRGTPYRGTNRVYYRKRRGSYRRNRRMRPGTRVRKEALGLFEGKRKVEVVRNSAITTAVTPVRTNLVGEIVNPLTNVGTGGDSIATSVTMAGREVFLRGIKIQMLAINDSTTTPVDVRIICGWRKINGDAALNIVGGVNVPFHIFKNTSNGKGAVQLNETAHGNSSGENGDNARWLLANAPLDPKVFHCEKDMTFRLGPANVEEEQIYGDNRKRVSIWWDLKNKRWGFKQQMQSTTTTLEREGAANWWPVMYFYHTVPLSETQPATTVNYWHSWITYFKDPLG